MLRSPKFEQRGVIFNSIEKQTGDASVVPLYNNINFTTDIITSSDHGFVTGDRVQYVRTAGPDIVGVAASTDYWVIKLTKDTFALASTAANAAAGTKIALSASTFIFVDGDIISDTFLGSAVDDAADEITATAHPFLNGDAVRLTSDGDFPTGLAVDTTYYVIVVDVDTISLATSKANAAAGTAIDIATGTSAAATITIFASAFAEATHRYSTGDVVRLTTTGVLPTGYALATNYYVIARTAGTFALASSAANAANGIEVVVTAYAGGGNHSVTLSSSIVAKYNLNYTDKIGGLDIHRGFYVLPQATGKYRVFLPVSAVSTGNYTVHLTSLTIDQVPVLQAKNVAYFDVWLNEIDTTAAYVDGNFSALIIKTDADLT